MLLQITPLDQLNVMEEQFSCFYLRFFFLDTWWTGILMMDGDVLQYEALTVEGSREEAVRNILISDLEEYSLVLAKGQLLGDRKNIYWVQNAHELEEDCLWEFFWYKD